MKLCPECGIEEIEDNEDMCETCMNNFGAGILLTNGIEPNEEDLL